MKVLSSLGKYRRHLLVLGLLVIVAGASFGFALWKEAQAANEYRTMIFNISKTMGEHPGCMD